MLYLNGSRYIGGSFNGRDTYFRTATYGNSAFLDLSVGDYVELYGAVDTVNNSSQASFYGGDRATFLTGYRITT